MSRIALSLATILLSPLAAIGQSPSAPRLEAPTTLPIVFTRGIDASHAKAGDPVQARTIQVVKLADGGTIPSGALVAGHVITAEGFAFDKTPYAKQKGGTLSIHFDSVQVAGNAIPLNVTVRAIADYFATESAYAPLASDLDSRNTRTLIGGDQLYASQDGVENREGDSVAYNRRSGVYAHLVPNGTCDGSSVEVSMAIYSASACGVYGFTGLSATELGSAAAPSTLTLVSSRRSPEVPKHATALLEVLPVQQAAR